MHDGHFHPPAGLAHHQPARRPDDVILVRLESEALATSHDGDSTAADTEKRAFEPKIS
jgi:hypothetical protein